ncbi:MAG: hypothetical protein WDN28_10410 [Chthoniobacter sp.]
MILISIFSSLLGAHAPAVSHWMFELEALRQAHGAAGAIGRWMLDILPLVSSIALFDDAEWKMGVGFLIGLIVFAAAIGAWRTLTGTDRTKADVRIESDFVTHTELDSRLQGLASEIERKFEKALHEEFKTLNGERSRSIGNLHEKIETTADGLRAELNEVRAMIVDMPARVVELIRARRG